MQSRKRKALADINHKLVIASSSNSILRSNSSSINHKLSSDSDNLSKISIGSSNISAMRNSRIVKLSDLGSNWRQNDEKYNKQLEASGSLEVTIDKKKERTRGRGKSKTILNCPLPRNTTENTKIDAGASNCPATMAMTKNIHCDLDEAGITKSSKSWTNNHSPIIRKTRYSRIGSWSELPLDYVQQQKAYFEEVDAFELPEEEISENELDYKTKAVFVGFEIGGSGTKHGSIVQALDS